MKNTFKLLALTLSLCAVGMAGCRGGDGGTTYGPEVEAAAIKKAMAGNIATYAGGTPVIVGQTAELDGDKNHTLTVYAKQLVNVDGTKAEVTFDWTYEDSYSSLINSFHVLSGNDSLKVFEFNYPTKGGSAAAFEFSVTPKCGTTTGDAVKYNVSLLPELLTYTDYHLSELLALNDAQDGFKHVTDAAKGYWEQNNPDVEGDDKYYLWANVFGKVVYLAPDGNWGLIADGAQYLEIYTGKGTALNEKYFPDLKVGNWVKVRGSMSNYQGNVQLGYIRAVTQVEQGSMVEPADYKALNEAYLNSYNQFNGDMNALCTITGTYAGGLNPASPTKGARATFKINVGSKELVIAYDYHTCKESDCTLFDEMMAVINAATVGSTSITIKGTLRFVASGDDKFTNAGTCQLTPFLAGDVVAA